jgi:S-adenosylmethionine decarboxylase proenzyme
MCESVPNNVGKHYLIDIFEADREKLLFVNDTQKLLEQIVKTHGLTSLNSGYKQFQPFGTSGFILLSESHISAHTWPEHNTVALDIFSCEQIIDDQSLVKFLKEFYKTDIVELKVIVRGQRSQMKQSKDSK